MSNVREILAKKGNAVWSVSAQDTVYDTLKFMAEKNIGAVLVMEDKKIVGIFTERDFARHSLEKNLKLAEIPVKSMMTAHILFVSPSQSTEECMSLMTAKRIRHLPVITDDELAAMKKMNPKSPAELAKEEEIRRFLAGEDIEPAESSHEHNH